MFSAKQKREMEMSRKECIVKENACCLKRVRVSGGGETVAGYMYIVGGELNS